MVTTAWMLLLLLVATLSSVCGFLFVLRKLVDSDTYAKVVATLVSCMVEVEKQFPSLVNVDNGAKKMKQAIELAEAFLTEEERGIACKRGGTLKAIAQRVFPILQALVFKKVVDR